MPKNKLDVFSNKGFYFGVAIFLLGFFLMVARVVLDIKSMKTTPTTETSIQKQELSEGITSLQNVLDQKIAQTPKTSSNKKFFEKTLVNVFKFDPVKNPDGKITAIEIIDLGCQQCLEDAKKVHRIIASNPYIKLISKVTNLSQDKNLHIPNLAAMIAAKKGTYFKFRNLTMANSSQDIDTIISNLEKSNVSMIEFRNAVFKNPDLILNNISENITEVQPLDIESYAIIINNVMFSDDINSEYKINNIPKFLLNI